MEKTIVNVQAGTDRNVELRLIKRSREEREKIKDYFHSDAQLIFDEIIYRGLPSGTVEELWKIMEQAHIDELI